MSLILVATVGGVLLERCVVARRSGVWGYAGAERWTRSRTVRGPHTPCSTVHCARKRTPSSSRARKLGREPPDEAEKLSAHRGEHPSGPLGDRNLLAGVGGPVAQLDRPALQPAPHRDDRRHAEQLGVLE